MIKDLRFHGSIGPVEYFAFISGVKAYNTYFCEEEQSRIRFFSRGNEFIISEDGISYKGTGGSFCEYMFGVEKPVKDTAKNDVLNRLIMFGAYMDGSEQVVFTNAIQGSEPFSRLFLQGHAVKNYYFLISTDNSTEHKKRQKSILRSVGKFLKRTDYLSDDRDTELLMNFYAELGETDSILLAFKMIHKANQEFYNLFKSCYSVTKDVCSEKEKMLNDIVVSQHIDQYQQERMKIDVMYRHSENRNVVDEYRNILAKGLSRESLSPSDKAKLNRLKTLSIRNNIPHILFDTLDDRLLKGKVIQEDDIKDYLTEVRAILQNLFFKDPSLKEHILKEDIVRLIRAKSRANAQSDRGFEQVLLDVGKSCDDLARETKDYAVFEEFTSIVTYFDRYDNVYAVLSQLAFMKNMAVKEASLRSLLGNKKEFDELDRDLFKSIFIKGLLSDTYITNYGKRKIRLISRGIEKVQHGEASIKDVMKEFRKLAQEETLYYAVHAALKEKMKTAFPGIDIRSLKRQLKQDITQELAEKEITNKIPARLFDKVFMDLRKESVYLSQILPRIINNNDYSLRRDFFENSGLDHFYIESIEQEYFSEKGLDSEILASIRENRELSISGGGERI